MPHLIACIHATPRAIGPTTRMLNERPGEFEQHDVLEEALFHLDAESYEALSALLRTMRQAEALKPAAILTTCSQYTQHLPAARRDVSAPVLGIDEAMIERAASLDGRLALVGSVQESIEFTGRQIEARSTQAGSATTIAKTVCVALDACDTVQGAQRLAEEVRRLSQEVDAVVVVQLSLSPVAEYLTGEENERVLTSPRLALKRLRELVKEPSV